MEKNRKEKISKLMDETMLMAYKFTLEELKEFCGVVEVKFDKNLKGDELMASKARLGSIIIGGLIHNRISR